MENKKYTVLLGQGDKTNENYKFDNLNVAKATASAFTLDDKYDTVALKDNETGNFISFDPKADLTEEQRRMLASKELKKTSYKEITLEHTSNDLQETRTANISAFHYNCEVGYGVTFKPESQDTEGIIWLRYTTDMDRRLYSTSQKLPNWKDAPVAWAFAVEALETTDIEPKHIRAYIEDLGNGTPLAPFKVK